MKTHYLNSDYLGYILSLFIVATLFSCGMTQSFIDDGIYDDTNKPYKQQKKLNEVNNNFVKGSFSKELKDLEYSNNYNIDNYKYDSISVIPKKHIEYTNPNVQPSNSDVIVNVHNYPEYGFYNDWNSSYRYNYYRPYYNYWRYNPYYNSDFYMGYGYNSYYYNPYYFNYWHNSPYWYYTNNYYRNTIRGKNPYRRGNAVISRRENNNRATYSNINSSNNYRNNSNHRNYKYKTKTPSRINNSNTYNNGRSDVYQQSPRTYNTPRTTTRPNNYSTRSYSGSTNSNRVNSSRRR